MRFGSDAILTNGSMSATTVTSNGVDLQQVWAFSIQANFSGINANSGNGLGTLKLQVSNDNVTVNLSGPSSGDPAVNVRNWCDYSGTLSSTSYATGSTSFTWLIADPGFRWVRMVYTSASGSGILSANYFGKGV